MKARRRDHHSRAASPIPKHPYRDTAILYGVLAVVLVVIAGLTGGDVVRATLVAVAFFVVATAWSWWRFRERIRDRDGLADEDRTAEDGNGAQKRPRER